MRCESTGFAKPTDSPIDAIALESSVCFLVVSSHPVIFDSSLLGELFYHQFMEPSPNRKEKRRNIHQQLEENPDEISQDSDSDQSMVYNIDPAPTSPFASFYVDTKEGV